jgi:uncharacterized Fe-S center protein
MKQIKKQIDRRDFLKVLGTGAAALSYGYAGGANYLSPVPSTMATAANAAEASKVYMTAAITPAGLMAAYKACGREVSGNVAVKLSTGEPGGHYFLSPDLIKELVQSVNGTIVECNVAYGGPRANTASHRQAAIDHGFTAIADVDIMDADGFASLPVTKSVKNLLKGENYVGSHINNYDSCLVLSHFKGHQMAGFGGTLKNISIGMAASRGKCWIHSGGTSTTNVWAGVGNPQAFLESMAEASSAVMDKFKDKMVFVNVMNNISIDCDCNGHPATPELDDIGVLASLDPVALDKACIDLINAADAQKSASLRQRIASVNGTHVIAHAEAIGIGSQTYELVSLDNSGTAIENISATDDSYQTYLQDDHLHVKGDFNHITLVDLNGATVAHSTDNLMNVSLLPTGVYVLQIETKNKGTVTKKIRKK